MPSQCSEGQLEETYTLDDLLKRPLLSKARIILEIKNEAEAEVRKLQHSFWLNIYTENLEYLIVYCILAGLGGAVVGYLGTWLILWFGGLAVYKLIRWFVFGFYEKKTKEEQKQ